jgi:hypothetical protein
MERSGSFRHILNRKSILISVSNQTPNKADVDLSLILAIQSSIQTHDSKQTGLDRQMEIDK